MTRGDVYQWQGGGEGGGDDEGIVGNGGGEGRGRDLIR